MSTLEKCSANAALPDLRVLASDVNLYTPSVERDLPSSFEWIAAGRRPFFTLQFPIHICNHHTFCIFTWLHLVIVYILPSSMYLFIISPVSRPSSFVFKPRSIDVNIMIQVL